MTSEENRALHKKMKFSIKDFFSKCLNMQQLRIWSHLPKTSFMENFIFFAVENQKYLKYFRANGSPPEILAQTPETFQYSATISKDSVNRNKKRTKKQLVKRAYIWFSFCTSWSFRVHNKISKTIVPLAW